MKLQHINFVLILALLITSSCYNDANMDEYRDDAGKNLLTLISVVSPDAPIQASATKTYFYADKHTNREYVKDLVIKIIINSEYKGIMKYDANKKLYVSDIKATPGDEIKLQTTYYGKNVSTSDVIPYQVEIENISASRIGPINVYSDHDYMVTYNITFTDKGDVDNYYFLRYDETDVHLDLHMGERDYSYEFVFQQLANHINSTLPNWKPNNSYGLPFSDKGINGKRHTIIVKELINGSSFNLSWFKQMNRKFRLYAISKPYYDYLVARIIYYNSDDDLQGGLIDLGMAEPIKMYSNIEGGVGIFGCYTTSEKNIDVFDFTGSFQ